MAWLLTVALFVMLLKLQKMCEIDNMHSDNIIFIAFLYIRFEIILAWSSYLLHRQQLVQMLHDS